MTAFNQDDLSKLDENNTIQDISLGQKFICNVCNFNLSKEKYFLNHVKICKDVEDPADRLGAQIINPALTKLESYEKRFEDKEWFDEHFKVTATIDYKFDELDSSESAQLLENPETTQSTQLEEVSKLHTRKKQYRCEYSTSHHTSIRAHKQSHSRQKSHKKHKISHLEEKLKQQIKPRTDQKQFKCSRCDYASTQRIHLTAHLAKHVGNKPFKCTRCDYATAHQGALANHMKTHTKEKPYKCTLCGYASAQRIQLTAHMSKHTGVKKYKCTGCDYATAHRGALINHVKTQKRNGKHVMS